MTWVSMRACRECDSWPVYSEYDLDGPCNFDPITAPRGYTRILYDCGQCGHSWFEYIKNEPLLCNRCGKEGFRFLITHEDKKKNFCLECVTETGVAPNIVRNNTRHRNSMVE